MRVKRTSEFDRPGPVVAALMFDPATMCLVMRPFVTVVPIAPAILPPRWETGRYRVAMRLFGIVPLGWEDIVVTDVIADASAGRWGFHDAGCGQFTRRWDHRLLVEGLPGNRSRYTDTVDIDAGLMTAVTWLFAWAVFSWRHRRWRRLLAGPFPAPPRGTK
jgi:hypothetical protein